MLHTFGAILAQAAPDPELVDGGASLLWLLLSFFGTIAFSFVSLGFWVWMAVHCWRKEPDYQFWLWIMVLFPPASLAYFVARWLPGRGGGGAPCGVKRFFRGGELARLESATLQIGNAHQFVQYGDALREVGRREQAKVAYLQALEKDDGNLQALWGAAQVDLELGRHHEAGERLQRLLSIDPGYKFGDVSLAWGRVLCETRQLDGAHEHLQKHVQRWRQPEALYLLACVQANLGRTQEARRTLEATLLDIRSCPGSIARKYGHWKSKATRMLKKLPA